MTGFGRLLAAALLWPQLAGSGTPGPVLRAIPQGGQPGPETTVRGVPLVTVVTYSLDRWYVEAVRAGPRPVLIWRRAIAGQPTRLDSPRRGVIRLLTVVDGGSGAAVYAFQLSGSSITSAISGRTSGVVTTDERAGLNKNGFVLERHDRSHTGSVPYRFVSYFVWRGEAYHTARTVHEPDLNPRDYPKPNATFRTAGGDIVLLRLEVAASPAARAQGLMDRASLDRDSGMVFIWPQPVLESFWMENTKIPLSIAFLGPNGRIHEIQDMQPETTDLHAPATTFQYAIEVNIGYFAANGIGVDSVASLNIPAGSSPDTAAHQGWSTWRFRKFASPV
ncbi:MAG TPA: DUF192 domain-containing protein [Chloroflexota bacterium]|nr:DUF192 domain-containing protein [Chloroflexota bacterium]